MSQAQTLKADVHELAHSVMHDVEPSRERASLPDRGTREVQAESIAYVVSSWLGLDTSDYSFGHTQTRSDGPSAQWQSARHPPRPVSPCMPWKSSVDRPSETPIMI